MVSAKLFTLENRSGSSGIETEDPVDGKKKIYKLFSVCKFDTVI